MGLLAGTVGADKARVQVSSTLNLDKAKERKLTYGDNEVELKRQRENEQLESEGGGARRPRRHRRQRPELRRRRRRRGGESNYERESDNTELGVDKTVRDTEFAQGAVEKQNVAVVLDASVAARRRPRDPDRRGVRRRHRRRRAATQLTVSRVAFAKPPAAKAASPVAGYLGYAKWAALGLAVLLFLFFVTRAPAKREREALGEPVWLREITAPQSLAALEADTRS